MRTFVKLTAALLAVFVITVGLSRSASAQLFTMNISNNYDTVPVTGQTLQYYEHISLVMYPPAGKTFSLNMGLWTHAIVTLKEKYSHYASPSVLTPSVVSSDKVVSLVEYTIPGQDFSRVRYFTGRIQQVPFRYSPNREVWTRRYEYWTSRVDLGGLYNEDLVGFSTAYNYTQQFSPANDDVWIPWK
jgi:hypothetical protein